MSNISKAPSQITKVQLLKAVLKRYQSGRDAGYICIDLRQTFQTMTGVTYGGQQGYASDQLVDWIRDQLYIPKLKTTAYTYESWVEVMHPETYKQMDDDAEGAAFHNGRVQWLEAMIVFWKEQEKQHA